MSLNSQASRVGCFAVAFAVMLVGPPMLSQPFPPYDLMAWADVVDVLTPVVVIPFYWLLFREGERPSTAEYLVFLVLAALWIEGQGMHLAANSVGHLLDETPATDASTLNHFYDEALSHYLWHLGVIGLSALLVWRQIRNPLREATSPTPFVLWGVLYGLVFFVIVVEGASIPLGLPFAIVLTLVVVARRSQLRRQPVTLFFGTAHLLALVMFLLWFLRWGSFVEFSQLGWI